MSTFTLAISCLTTSNLPWFMDLTFQVPMQYCSVQQWTLLLSPVTSTSGYRFCFGSISSFFLELFLHWSPVALGHLPKQPNDHLNELYHFAFPPEMYESLCCSTSSPSFDVVSASYFGSSRQHIKKQRHYFANKVRLVKAMVFPVMYECERWAIKKAEHWRIDAFELWWWRRLLRVPWTARRSNQSILKQISPACSLEGLMLKLKLQYFGHLMWRTDLFEKTLMLGKIEGGIRRGW